MLINSILQCMEPPQTLCLWGFRSDSCVILILLDDGTVNGVPSKAAPDMVKNFITVISNPAYETDALMDFIKKHLPDKFFLEDENRVSLRDIIAREIVSNTLMHREYTSSYAAKLVIKKDRMYTENANRADRLGSGVHKLFKYTKFYSEKDPVFEEGDVFRIVVPLDDDYSFDIGIGSETNRETKETNQETNTEIKQKDFIKINMAKALAIITEEPQVTQSELKDKLQISLMSVKRLMKTLQDNGMIERIGSNRKGYWKITKKDGHSNL